MKRTWMLAALVVLLAGPAVWADSPARDIAVYDSLSRIPPRMRARWLAEHGIDLPEYFEPRAPESTGLRLVGKFGRGPSVEVTGRDSLVFLSLGSEVAIINFANPDNPRILAEVQALGLVVQAAVRDSFLYIGCMTGAAGIEVWNIADPRNPVFRNRVLSRLTDFCIQDTFAYVTSRTSSPSYDTFKVYNLADPDDPRLTGFCRDSGAAVTVAGNTVVLGDWDNLFTLDVSDPAHPHRVGSYPGWAISVAARGNICCVTFDNSSWPGELRFTVLDLRNPANPVALGSIDSCGGEDVYLADTLAFLSGSYVGGHVFRVLSIGDSARPRHVGSTLTPGERFGVWANRAAGKAYVADRFRGITLIDVTNPASPVVDTSLLSAGTAVDVSLDGTRAYVAGIAAGMAILDVTNPALPVELAHVDSTRGMITQAAAARDSFAFMGWQTHPWLKVVDVSDPAAPSKAGACDLFNPPEDMVLRDSLLYVAEDYRFQVVNVARPRQPVVVGNCGLPSSVHDLDIADSLAFVTTLPPCIVNIARPNAPYVAGSWDGDVSGVDLVDTIAYVVGPYVGCMSLSIADPASPRVLDSLFMTDTLWWTDVVVVGSLAYVGGERVWGVDVSDPGNLRLVSGIAWTPPRFIERLAYAEPYIYAACLEAGVCILESTAVAVEQPVERQPIADRLLVAPNPLRDELSLRVPAGFAGGVSARDVTGRLVASVPAASRAGVSVRLDVAGWSAGVYFVEALDLSGRRLTVKVVKR